MATLMESKQTRNAQEESSITAHEESSIMATCHQEMTELCGLNEFRADLSCQRSRELQNYSEELCVVVASQDESVAEMQNALHNFTALQTAARSNSQMQEKLIDLGANLVVEMQTADLAADALEGDLLAQMQQLQLQVENQATELDSVANARQKLELEVEKLRGESVVAQRLAEELEVARSTIQLLEKNGTSKMPESVNGTIAVFVDPLGTLERENQVLLDKLDMAENELAQHAQEIRWWLILEILKEIDVFGDGVVSKIDVAELGQMEELGDDTGVVLHPGRVSDMLHEMDGDVVQFAECTAKLDKVRSSQALVATHLCE